MTRILIAALAALTLAGCTKGELELYQDRCHERGGIVSRHDMGWTSVTFSCVGQSKGPQLPDLQR